MTLSDVARVGLYHIKTGRRAAMRAAAQAHPGLFVPEAGSTLTV